jgi:rRNA maturation endonuclease Nob1
MTEAFSLSHVHEWIPIVYGKPSEATIERARAGELVLAGCSRYHNAPKQTCKTCGLEV